MLLSNRKNMVRINIKREGTIMVGGHRIKLKPGMTVQCPERPSLGCIFVFHTRQRRGFHSLPVSAINEVLSKEVIENLKKYC